MANSVDAVLPALTGSGYQALRAEAAIAVGVNATASAASVILVVTDETVGVTAAITTIVYHNAEIPVAVAVDSSASVTDVINVLARTLIKLGFAPATFGDAAQVWVLNTENNASSRYAGYNFNSYGMFDQHYVGAREDGIYLLEGEDDAGTQIEAMLDFGDLDFSVDELKHVTAAYLGIAADRHVYIKVIDGEQEYIYRSRGFDAIQHQERVGFGRGLRSNLFGFELYGNGARFDLRSISFVPLPTKRRIVR